MFDTVFVTPKSKKARNRFANLMDNNPECIVEQHVNNRLFLRSVNDKNFFWVSINQDSDWEVEL
jgi:hypothetical protein